MSHQEILTILIVGGPGDEELLRKNLLSIQNRNDWNDYVVHVLDNGLSHGHDPIRLEFPNVQVHHGCPHDPKKPNACRGSYQHAGALNQFLVNHEILTPYLLILDPDFFILRENWIRTVTSHMSQKGLAFWGAPWHPKWYSKHRYFPCVHCFFFFTWQVDCQRLDFTPDLIERGQKADRKNGIPLVESAANLEKIASRSIVPKRWVPVFFAIIREVLDALRNIYVEAKQPIPITLLIARKGVWFIGKIQGKLRAFLSLGASLTLNRRIIGSANDTGWLIERKYCNSSISSETLVPYVNLKKDFSKPQYLNSWWGPVIEGMVPERWSYLPKRRNYFTTKGFGDHGLPDLGDLGWEEFMWENSPFGFHMRRYNKVKRNLQEESLMLVEILKLNLTEVSRAG